MHDFNYWADLATNNPSQFEIERRTALLNAANEAPEHLRVKLLSLVETLTNGEEGGTALEQAVRAQNLMLASLADLQSGFSRLLVATHQGPLQLPIQSFIALEVKNIEERPPCTGSENKR